MARHTMGQGARVAVVQSAWTGARHALGEDFVRL
jgi:hypothetical protein